MVKRCRQTLLVGLVASGWLAGAAVAGDWPQWRGPDRTDVSTETGLLQAWPTDGPDLVWTFEDSGIGFSGPAVVDGTLYVMGARKGVEQLLELWES